MSRYELVILLKIYSAMFFRLNLSPLVTGC